MGLYGRVVLPRLLALAMRHPGFAGYRQRAAGGASGRVLELGIGTGLNLAFYGPQVQSVIGLDPSAELLALAERQRAKAGFPVELLHAAGEQVPLDSRSVDTVLTTWTLCSVCEPLIALQEVRRVLKPGGRLIFVEHGRAPDPGVRVWQDRITPVWRHLAGGCHLNRPVDAMVAAAGFRTETLRTGYMSGPRIGTFMYEGQAVA